MENNKAIRFLLSAIISLLVISGAFAQQPIVLAAFNGRWEIDMKKTGFEQVRVPDWILPRSFNITIRNTLRLTGPAMN